MNKHKKSQTAVYHFTASELRKRLRLPATAKFIVGTDSDNEFVLDDDKITLKVEVKP